MSVRIIIGVMAYFFCVFSALGQDLHFSQYYHSPLSANPANTGFLPDADYRMGIQYRNQWSSLMAQPYRTFSAFADGQIFRNKFENGWLGVGALFMGDEAGSGVLRSAKAYGSVAYHQLLGNSSLLGAGFNMGWSDKRIDVSKLKFPDQFDGNFFDGKLPTSVVLDNTSVQYFDLQAGINYAYFPKEDIYFQFGFSLHHINRPKESFFSNSEIDSRIPDRKIAFASGILKLNSSWIFSPSAYFTSQSGAREFSFGVMCNRDLSGDGSLQLLAGLYTRVGDAVIPSLGLQFNTTSICLTYDATISGLSNFNGRQGATEISIIRKSDYPVSPGRQALCPSF
jgi:type IX secretion system PorP/SprF family membrane protein